MRLACLIFTALLTGVALAGQALAQDAAAPGSASAEAVPPVPFDWWAAVILPCLAAVATAVKAWLEHRKAVKASASADAASAAAGLAIEWIEKRATKGEKAQIQLDAIRKGVEPALAAEVAKATKRLEKPAGGGA